MGRLKLGQLLVLLTISTELYAADLRDKIAVSLEDLNYENCTEVTNNLITDLDNLSSDEMLREIKEDGHQSILSDLWSSKVKFHERLRSFQRIEKLSPSCAEGIRGVFRGIRTYEDYVEFNYRHTDSVTFPASAFEEGNIHVKRHPEFSSFDLNHDLKSGDIILSRGNAYTSAAISMLGEYDTQFSHLSMVYKDEKGKIWTVEAHIEVGSFVRPLEDHIEDNNFRTMVFRYDDEALAAKAAVYIFNKVKKASDTRGNINYDFGFDNSDSKELFCSEIASYSFKAASNNTVAIPQFMSRVQKRKPLFMEQLGISVNESFIPGDLEIDPRFKMIAEWKDAGRVKDILQKDALIQSMYEWSDKYNYVLVQSSSKDSLLYRNVAWPLRRVPFLKKYFKDKLPLNMSRKLIGYFGVLESTGKFLQKKINEKDEVSINERGLPLLKSEKAQVLEEVRLEDLRLKKQRLHKMYRPKKSKN